MSIDDRDEQSPEELINLPSLFASKSPALAKRMPGFVYRYLNRVIHVPELNESLGRLKDKRGLEFVREILSDFGARIEIVGAENLFKTERCFVVANHPLGGLDGLALIQAVADSRPDKPVVFPVNDLLLNLPNLQDVFVPVNKHGRNTQNIKVLEETFSGEKTVLYFPAGLCSRKQKGQICDLEWKKTFVTKARKYQRDVVPVYINGRNSNFFYGLANWRKRLGIKANIEMLYLVDEMFKQKDKTIQIIFGEPIPYDTFTRNKPDREWSRLVKAHVYQIGQGKMPSFKAQLK